MPHDEITLENMQAYMKARQEKFEAEVAEILAQHSWEDTPTTTVIHGKNYWGTCYRHACYLAKYIYSLPNNPDFYTEYPEKMAEVEEHWQQWDFLDHASGLMGALFKQKGYDPASEKALCPPMLVFRGTDFEDFRGLAALVRFRISKGVWKTFLYPWIGENGIYVKNWDRRDFIKAGYDEHLLYKEKSVAGGLLARSFGLDWNVNINTKIELYIYTKGGYGDWLNNITQGIGKESEQYKRAIRFGRDTVKGKIINAEDKRLMVTGHSLGGGLAAATCCVLNASYPDITFDSIIFNAAGVHHNTIAKEIEPEISVGGAMSRNPCIDICVQDEILTTLGAYHKKLPILGSIFTYVARYIGQHGLPNPPDIAQLFDIPGYSPGTSAQQAKHTQDFESLPNHIKPILESDADKAAMEMKQAFDHMTASGNELEFSKNMQDLGNRGMRNRQLASMINEGQYGEAVQKIDEILEAEAPREDAPYEAALKHTRSVLAAEISPIALPPKGVALRRLFPIEQQNATAMPRPDGFPLITALDSFFYNSHDISDVLTKLLKFLNQRYGEGARDKSLTPWGTYEKMIERFISDLQPEIDVIMLLMALSSEYHGMDIVIASYEAMLAEHQLNKEQKQQKAQQRENQHELWREQEAEKERLQLEELTRQMQYQNYQPGAADWQRFHNMRP